MVNHGDLVLPVVGAFEIPEEERHCSGDDLVQLRSEVLAELLEEERDVVENRVGGGLVRKDLVARRELEGMDLVV